LVCTYTNVHVLILVIIPSIKLYKNCVKLYYSIKMVLKTKNDPLKMAI
jgi:hypothetical protein